MTSTTHLILADTFTGLLLPLAGCGESSTGSPSGATSSPSALPRGREPVELDPSEFTATSDHPFFPIEPGRQWTYRELEASVVRDTVTEDGALIEDTLDWYAQDAHGNVWYLGEDTAEFEDGELTTRAGSFEAGVDGALRGIIMPADPAVGMSYRREY